MITEELTALSGTYSSGGVYFYFIFNISSLDMTLNVVNNGSVQVLINLRNNIIYTGTWELNDIYCSG